MGGQGTLPDERVFQGLDQSGGENRTQADLHQAWAIAATLRMLRLHCSGAWGQGVLQKCCLHSASNARPVKVGALRIIYAFCAAFQNCWCQAHCSFFKIYFSYCLRISFMRMCSLTTFTSPNSSHPHPHPIWKLLQDERVWKMWLTKLGSFLNYSNYQRLLNGHIHCDRSDSGPSLLPHFGLRGIYITITRSTGVSQNTVLKTVVKVKDFLIVWIMLFFLQFK